MRVEFFNHLPDEAMAIRKAVFMVEQGFCEEFDATDGACIHAVLYENNSAVGTCRFWYEGEGFVLGRLAVLAPYRGRGAGALLIDKTEEHAKSLGGASMRLHAQKRAVGFYERQGYIPYGDWEPDEGYPHIWMKKELI